MRKKLLEAIIAVVLEESVRKFIPPLLPYAWLVILWLLTLEVLESNKVKKALSAFYARLGTGGRVLSFLLVGLIGAGVSMGYWLTIQQAISAVNGLSKPEPPKSPEAPIKEEKQLIEASEEKPKPELTNPAVSPVDGLSKLGWAVQPGTDAIQFEIANKPLPPMKESAAYFGRLHKPFRLHFQSVKSIEGLRYLATLSNCTKIEINAGEFTDISELRGFKSLTSLVISQTPLNGFGVVDASPISSLINIRELILGSTRVTNLSALIALKKLEVLNVDGTLVRDLSPIAGLTSLKQLEIRNTEISNLAVLSQIEALQELGIGPKQSPSLVNLSMLKNLKKLRIIGEGEIDLSAVSTLSHLEHLWIWNTFQLNLAPLRKLVQLQELTLTGIWFDRAATVTDIDAIGNLKELRKLTLGSLQISDLTFANSLKNLTEINIGQMPVSSVEPLRGLVSLKSVSLNQTLVVDISPLLDLPALTNLSVIRTPARADVLTQLERRGVKIQR